MNDAGSGALQHEFSRAIGGLEAGVENLTKTVDREADTASKHRESLREVLAALTESLRVLTKQQSDWEREWKERWEPLLEEYEASRHEAAGRAKLGRAILALWMAVAGAAVSLITWLIGHWK